MNSYDFNTKTYKYSEDPEVIRNRKNKSVLIITDCKEYQVPSKSLHPDVSFPEQVKCLSIYCEGDTGEYSCPDVPIDVFNNLVLFHNLQYLCVQGVYIEMKYWIEFARNSKFLKELYLEENVNTGHDFFKFNEETLEILLKISTLEKVTLKTLKINFFPKGPSNIKELNINKYWKRYEGHDQFYENITQNLCTHTNLEILTLINCDLKEMMIKVTDNCIKLKELNWESTVDMDLFEKLLKMPKLEYIQISSLNLDRDLNFSQEFPTIQYLEITPNYYNKNYDEFFEIKTFLVKLCKHCPNMKSCFFNKK
jgi:hypothetical protein